MLQLKPFWCFVENNQDIVVDKCPENFYQKNFNYCVGAPNRDVARRCFENYCNRRKKFAA